jgi:hypothetical protein
VCGILFGVRGRIVHFFSEEPLPGQNSPDTFEGPSSRSFSRTSECVVRALVSGNRPCDSSEESGRAAACAGCSRVARGNSRATACIRGRLSRHRTRPEFGTILESRSAGLPLSPSPTLRERPLTAAVLRADVWSASPLNFGSPVRRATPRPISAGLGPLRSEGMLFFSLRPFIASEPLKSLIDPAPA